MKKGELVAGSTSMMVLRLLEQKSMHGYEIIKTMETVSGGVFTLNEGTLYPILHGLENEGYIEAAWEENTGRKRRVYTLTQQGGAVLRDRRLEWERVRNAVDAVMGGLEHVH